MAKDNTSKKGVTPSSVIIAIVLVIAMFVSVFPFAYMLFIACTKTTSMRISIDTIVNAKYTLQNFVNLFQHADMVKYLKNSVIVTVYSVVINCVFCSLAAYGFAKKKFPCKNAIFLGYLATMMIPGQVTLIPSFLILKNMGLLNTYSAIGLTSFSAFGVLLIHQFLEKLPNELLEAADIDGCGEIRKFTDIVLPLIKPSIISLAIFTFISAWGSLIHPLIMLTTNDKTTLTVAIANMSTLVSDTDYGYQMAAACFSFLPPFILYLFLQKEFVEGIALSGVKT